MFFLPWWFAGSMNHSGKKRRRPQGRLRQGQAVSVVIAVATVVTILICSETDLLRPAPELKDIQPGPVAVGSVDEAAVVDLEVVGHVAVRLDRVSVGHRNVERNLDRRLGLADVPHGTLTFLAYFTGGVRVWDIREEGE